MKGGIKYESDICIWSLAVSKAGSLPAYGQHRDGSEADSKRWDRSIPFWEPDQDCAEKPGAVYTGAEN